MSTRRRYYVHTEDGTYLSAFFGTVHELTTHLGREVRTTSNGNVYLLPRARVTEAPKAQERTEVRLQRAYEYEHAEHEALENGGTLSE